MEGFQGRSALIDCRSTLVCWRLRHTTLLANSLESVVVLLIYYSAFLADWQLFPTGSFSLVSLGGWYWMDYVILPSFLLR